MSCSATLGFLATGTFARVVAICSVMFVASYAVSFAAVFRLRAAEPDASGPFRAIAHPFSTGLVPVGTVVFLVGTAMSAPIDAAIAAVLIVCSYPLYRMLR